MHALRIVTVAVAAILLAAPAGAELTLEFRDGRVTLIAREVSIREILTEWARVGETHIGNAEQLSTVPVTLQLEDVPEALALDTVLLSAAGGYVAVSRGSEKAGRSQDERVLVMAVSNPPPPSDVRSESPPAQREAEERHVIREPIFGTGADEAEDEISRRAGTADVTSPLAPGLPAAAWTPGTLPGTSVFGAIVPPQLTPRLQFPLPGGEPLYPEREDGRQ